MQHFANDIERFRARLNEAHLLLYRFLDFCLQEVERERDWSLSAQRRELFDMALCRYAQAYITEDWEDLYDFERVSMEFFFLGINDE